MNRKIIALALIFILVGISFFYWFYSSTRRPQFEYEYTVYSSPEEGEELKLGDWLYGSFTGPDVPENEHLVISFRLDILAWGACPDEMRFQNDFRSMTIDEFLNLSEADKITLFAGAYSTITKPKTTYGYGIYGGPIEAENYVWTIRFTDSDGNSRNATLSFRASIEIFSMI